MRKTVLTALAVATILSGGMIWNQVHAMTRVVPLALGVAGADAALIQRATVVCGGNGCVPVQTSRPRKHRPHP